MHWLCPLRPLHVYTCFKINAEIVELFEFKNQYFKLSLLETKLKTGPWRHNFWSTEENCKGGVAEKAMFLFLKIELQTALP